VEDQQEATRIDSAQDAIAEFRASVADLAVCDEDKRSSGLAEFAFSPRNPRAAKVWVGIKGSELIANVGDVGHWDLGTDTDDCAFLRQLLAAARDGRVVDEAKWWGMNCRVRFADGTEQTSGVILGPWKRRRSRPYEAWT
jgi:hypothetical protein